MYIVCMQPLNTSRNNIYYNFSNILPRNRTNRIIAFSNLLFIIFIIIYYYYVSAKYRIRIIYEFVTPTLTPGQQTTFRFSFL